MPSSGTFSIGTNSRDYSTISGWEADTDVSLTGKVTGECYDDSQFDEQTIITGATNLSSTVYREITAADGEEHDGTESTGVQWTDSDTGSFREVCTLAEDYARCSWIVFYEGGNLTTDGTRHMHMNAVTEAKFLNCLSVRGAKGFECHSSAVDGLMANSIVYGTVQRGVSMSSGSFKIHNCVIYDAGNDGIDGIGGSTVEIYNTIVIGSGGDDYQPDTISASSHNVSGDSTIVGTNGTTFASASDYFVNPVTTSSADFHLKSGSDGIDAGTDLGDVPAKIDIDGGDRHAAGVVWDQGADEEGLPVPVTTVTVGQATETDTAQPVTAAKTLTVGQATEADVGFSTGWSKILSVGLANEVDTGFSVNPVESQAIGLASEVDTGLSVGFLKVGVVAVGLAQEQNLGLAVGRSKVARVGLATEVDAAFGITPTASLRVGLANEVDAAFGIDWIKLLSAGLAREIDTAFGVTPRQPINVGLATEVDTALVVGPVKVYSVGLATERGIAFSIVGERFAARSTQQIIEVANTRPDLAAQVTQMPVEVWSRQELQAFITQFNIEHLARYVIDGRPTQLILEVLRSVGGVPIGCPQGEDVTFTTESSEDTGFISPGPGVDPDFISLGPEVDPDF